MHAGEAFELLCFPVLPAALAVLGWVGASWWHAAPLRRAWLREQLAEVGRVVAGEDERRERPLGEWIEGRVDGRATRVRAFEGARRGAFRVEYEVELDATCPLEVRRPALDEAVRFPRRPDGLQVHGDEVALARLARAKLLPELLVDGRDLLRAGLGTLRLSRSVRDLDGCLEDLRLLSRAAAELEGLGPSGSGRLRVRTRGPASACCPWCRDDLGVDASGVAACTACGTGHHRDCLELAGGCTIFACEGGPAVRRRLTIRV